MNPDRVKIWTNAWEWVKLVASLKWWFTFGDFIMDRVNGSNNAGDFKFRKNMIIIWLMLWAGIITILPDTYEFFPFLAVLWGAVVFSND